MSSTSSMDILKPAIIRIGNRRYRKNPIKDSGTSQFQEEEEIFTEGGRSCVWSDEMCDMNTNIEETESGYSLSMDIPTAFFKFLIGKKGETKKRLETETRTQVRIPKQGHEGEVVIVGHERGGVLSAKTRIEVLVDSARQKQAFTHFLSFPINSDSVKNHFAEFKDDVLLSCDGDSGLDETIFQNADKLHMTVGMLVLLNQAEVEKAAQLLQQCQEDLVSPILRGEPLITQVKGLEYMNDDPGAVDVLYAKMELGEQSQRLQILADRLVDKFVSAGLMQREFDKVKLHITVINSLMRKDPSGALLPRGKNRKGPPRESFDASNILKNFGAYDFGQLHMKELHLSQRYSAAPNGYYANDGVLRLP